MYTMHSQIHKTRRSSSYIHRTQTYYIKYKNSYLEAETLANTLTFKTDIYSAPCQSFLKTKLSTKFCKQIIYENDVSSHQAVEQ